MLSRVNGTFRFEALGTGYNGASEHDNNAVSFVN